MTNLIKPTVRGRNANKLASRHSLYLKVWPYIRNNGYIVDCGFMRARARALHNRLLSERDNARPDTCRVRAHGRQKMSLANPRWRENMPSSAYRRAPTLG